MSSRHTLTKHWNSKCQGRLFNIYLTVDLTIPILGLPNCLITLLCLIINICQDAFYLTKNSWNSRWGSEWNIQFLEFHSQVLCVHCEVGLIFQKIGITRKFNSIIPFLLRASFSEPGKRIQHGIWQMLTEILTSFRE